MPRVGVLWHAANADAEGPYFRALMQGFRDLGYVEGRNITTENRFPNEVPARFESMAAELVALQVDVLIGVGAIASQYVKNASATIPIVFIYAPDPVGSKLVDSLAHPGGNATGLTIMAPELTGKRLQLLKETVPGLTRVALLTNPNAQISNRI
jgi:putative tryptophan/tyrosine transport system substrate-binding protein